MIAVSHLTKTYQGVAVVDDISFTVERGEVVGFLGPNGAGKTTTMRILAGYLAASGGDVQVAGFDVRDESLDVRRRTGYLPESVPLYPEMRVDEYLRYRARIKGLNGGRLRTAVASAKERCGLGTMGRELIGRLSRGYRQRVGLADALVHEPDLLILDEPTLGLDPDQNRQVRNLIRELAATHTILLCTHFLPEVERTCNRVLVMRQGRIVAADTPSGLSRQLSGGQHIRVEIKGVRAEIKAGLQALPGLTELQMTPEGAWWLCLIKSTSETDLRTRCYDLAVRHGWRLRELACDGRSLEDAYLELTRT